MLQLLVTGYKTATIITISLLFVITCKGQNKYFHPTDITDKTEELKQKNSSWTFIKDKESVDGYTRIGDSVFGGEISCNIKPLAGIDVKTFRVLPGTKYAKDKNHVYYPISILCEDRTDCGVCFFEDIIVKGANPATFKCTGNGHGTDGKRIYFKGELVNK